MGALEMMFLYTLMISAIISLVLYCIIRKATEDGHYDAIRRLDSEDNDWMNEDDDED